MRFLEWLVLLAANIVAGTMAGVRYDQFLLGEKAVKCPEYSQEINRWYMFAAVVTGLEFWFIPEPNTWRYLVSTMTCFWLLWSLEVLCRLPNEVWPKCEPAELANIKRWFIITSLSLGFIVQIVAADLARKLAHNLNLQ